MHEAEDKKKREAIDKRNSLDSMIMSIEKTIKENKEKLPIAEVNNVEKALEEAKLVLKEKENDGEALAKATDDLTKASHKIAEIIYKEQQTKQDAQGEQENATDQSKQGPIETDFEQKQ